jgi:ribosomal protein S18 acetylase RimI-like enzyme
MRLTVEVARAVDDELVEALRRLVPQLSAAPPPDDGAIRRLVDTPGVHLLLARADGRIVGMLTLATFPTPTRLRAVIEDVVVDSAARGHGAGTALLGEAARIAGEAGAPWMDLTSRPVREAANRLYRSFGFQLRETNAYRLTF